ncbi:MAG: hypothetical protein ACLFVJ_04945, partial [Persicimonas sp.]
TVRIEDVDDEKLGFYDAYSDDTAGVSLRGLASLRLLADTDAGRFDTRIYGQARRLELDENFTGRLQTPDRGDRRLQAEDAWTAGGLARWARRLAPTAKLSGLLEWRSVWAGQREDQITDSGAVWRQARALEFVEHLGAVGLGADWSPVSWLRVDAGARVDTVGLDARDTLDDASGTRWFAVASPRLAATVFAGLDWAIFCAYGRGLRPPEARAVVAAPRDVQRDDSDAQNRDHTRYAGGDPAPTTTDNVELGVKWTPTSEVELSAAGFGVWIDRESVFDHVAGTNVELSATERYGVEAVAQWSPVDWLGLEASATAVEARFRESGRPVPGAPRLLASAHASLIHPDGWRGGLAGRAVGARPLGLGAKAAPYALIDATAGYRWDWFQLDVHVENALGTRWREGEYHYASWWDPSAPRSNLPSIHYVAGPPRGLRATLSAWF